MFTGIVAAKVQVQSISPKEGVSRLCISVPNKLAQDLKTGASIAINGTCLTVVDFHSAEDQVLVEFDVIQQSLQLTNLGGLDLGHWVNFERAAKFGDEIGGHLMSGHISQTVEIVQIKQEAGEFKLQFRCSDEIRPYIFDKGFVGLDGCSLTISDVEEFGFWVCLIPETLSVTCFGHAKLGDKVNLEIDPQTQVIVDTVAKMTKPLKMGQ